MKKRFATTGAMRHKGSERVAMADNMPRLVLQARRAENSLLKVLAFFIANQSMPEIEKRGLFGSSKNGISSSPA